MGSNSLYGRLFRNGDATFNANYPNQPGQLAFEFGHLFGFGWYNHGIPSQTTSEIWARWRRDVLAETYDPGDGRGSKTLDKIPKVVYVHTGLNDVNNGVAVATIQQNFINMAQSAIDNGFKIIFSNIPPSTVLDATELATAKSINTWMAATLPTYGAFVVDEFTWAEIPANGGAPNAALYSDGTHPTMGGYTELARYIYQQLLGKIIPI